MILLQFVQLLISQTLYFTFRGLRGLESSFGSRSKKGNGCGSRGELSGFCKANTIRKAIIGNVGLISLAMFP